MSWWMRRSPAAKARLRPGSCSSWPEAQPIAVNKITPILKAMGRDVVHVGPVGSGARLKLINNFLSGSQAAALAEALSLIERSGLDGEKALGVLTEGAPGSPIVKLLSGRMTERQYEPHFLLRLMAKDLRYAVSEADHVDLDLDMGRAALRVFEHAITAGQGEEDMSAVVEQFRIQAQTPGEENARQTLCPVDVPLGDRPHHPRHQSHRPPGGVGVRLAAGVCPVSRLHLASHSGRRCRGGAASCSS